MADTVKAEVIADGEIDGRAVTKGQTIQVTPFQAKTGARAGLFKKQPTAVSSDGSVTKTVRKTSTRKKAAARKA
jgi:hypothetical protein